MSIDGMFGTGHGPDGAPCGACDGTGHVCADDGTASYPAGSHGDRLHPWDGLSLRADACDHGGGMPCPVCMIAPGDEPENPPTVVDGLLGPNLLPARREHPHARPDLAPCTVHLPDWDPEPPLAEPDGVGIEPDRPTLETDRGRIVADPRVPEGMAYLLGIVRAGQADPADGRLRVVVDAAGRFRTPWWRRWPAALRSVLRGVTRR